MICVDRYVVGILSTNCYLVYPRGSSTAVLIDPGRSHARISLGMQQQGIRDIAAVLLTHGHFDHMLDARYWQQTGARVYVHALDADKLRDGEKNLSAAVGAPFTPLQADVLLQDGDTVEEAGMKFEVLHTPGHSVGGVVYRLDDLLFTGDTLFCGTFGRTDFADSSMEELVGSLKRLFQLPGDFTVYPGHGESTTLQIERATNPIRSERQWKQS